MSEEQKTLRELRREAAEARDELDLALRATSDKISARVMAQEKVIRESLLKDTGPEIDRLSVVAADLTRRAEAAQIEASRKALAAMADPRRAEWRMIKYSRRLEKTGRTGQYEVCTRESEFGGSTTEPKPGEVFLRINKNDGTPSLLFKRRGMNGGDPVMWHPVGWSPEQ